MARKKVETNISFDEMRQKYYVCMDYGLDETGKRVKKYKTYPTLAQARRGLRDFQTEQDTHQTVAPRSMTLDQWLEYWMEEVIQPNRAATTIYGYRKIIDNHLSDALGSVPIQKLTPQHLQQYYSMLMRDKGLSANTVRRHHDLLSCALHMALRQDIILRCPTERVEPPRVIPHEARFYTPAELKRLFGLVEGHWLELIVKLAGSLGLRREEICGLRWSSVDFELRKLHIKEARTAAGAEIVQKETKNRSSNRILHMSDDLYRLLRRERARQAERRLALGDAWPDTGMVAVDAKGNPYSPNAVSLAFTRFIQAHHLPKITLHGLRHPYVKHTTKIFSLRLMDFQAQAYPDARRKTRGACQLHRGGQSQSPVRPLCNRERFSCLPPQSKISWILYATSIRLSGYTSTRSISSSASSVVSVSASKITLDASLRLSCRACSSCFCFACANTAA